MESPRFKIRPVLVPANANATSQYGIIAARVHGLYYLWSNFAKKCKRLLAVWINWTGLNEVLKKRSILACTFACLLSPLLRRRLHCVDEVGTANFLTCFFGTKSAPSLRTVAPKQWTKYVPVCCKQTIIWSVTRTVSFIHSRITLLSRQS